MVHKHEEKGWRMPWPLNTILSSPWKIKKTKRTSWGQGLWNQQTARRRALSLVWNSKPASGNVIACKYEHLQKLYLLGHTAVYPAENKPTFRRNIPPPSSGLKCETSKKVANKVASINRLRPFMDTVPVYCEDHIVAYRSVASRWLCKQWLLLYNACRNRTTGLCSPCLS
jgi:hypothetical protein